MAEPFFPAELIAFVARSARVTPQDILGTRKPGYICRARAVVAKVLVERGLSYTGVGRVLNRHHTTIMYTIDTFEERYGTDPVAQYMLDYARYEFLEGDPPAPAPPAREPVELPTPILVADRLRDMEIGDVERIPVNGRRDIKRVHHRVSQYGMRTGKGFRGRSNADKTAVEFIRVR